MRRTIPAVLAVLFAVCARAQGPAQGGPGEEGGPELTPDAWVQRLDSLGLDDKQKAAIEAAAQESFEKTRPQREELSALREKMRGVRKQLDEELRGLEERTREQLTLEQKDRFDRMRLRGRLGGEERGPRGPEREFRPEGMPGRRGWGSEQPGQTRPEEFPPEMWHEHAPPGGGPPPGRDPRMAPPEQPPGAPSEPGGQQAPSGGEQDMGGN